jgi:DNA-binding SARP family transcriptional activator/tetratricopeptide (TPR) repeat protein
MMSSFEFRILGPLEVSRDGVPVALPSAKQRVVLATLLLKANQPVHVDELVDRLWETGVPAARSTAQAYVMRLRRSLGDPAKEYRLIRTEPNGYVLAVEPGQVDLHRFRARVREADVAAAAGDRETETARLHEALALWRGRPLSNVPSELLRREDVPWLSELRVHALERRLQSDVDSGRQAAVIAELQALTAEYPLRERFWAQLMLALFRANRQADALEAHRRLSRILADELGLTPGEEVRDLRAMILANAPSAPAPVLAPPPGRQPVPLPPDVAGFVGREDEVAALRNLLVGRAQRLVVVSGPPGVGKTALALHVAHGLRDDFPGGRLHVNLQGYATGNPMTTSRALTHLLRGLGMRPQQIPMDPEEQADLYQSTLAGNRVLVVLDNAGSPDQVRPLLPIDAACSALVTSRNELRGLTALQGARRLTLDALREADARLLLADIAGPGQIDAEPEAVKELVRLCARLPLAVRIAAANLSSRPRWSVADYVAELSLTNTLAALSIEDDEQAAVRTAFGLSYEALKPRARYLFRMLGLVPGPDFTAAAAAAITGEPVELSALLLERLASVSLLQHHSPGRYQFHDLLRLYARDRAELEESPEHLATALGRLYGYHLSAADRAGAVLNPALPRLTRPEQAGDLPVPEFADHEAAVRWLNDERANLVAAAEAAPAPLNWHLADAMTGYLHSHRHDGELQATATAALASAREEGDRLAEATMLNALGVLGWSVGDYPGAATRLERSLAMSREIGDRAGIAATLCHLGVVRLEEGSPADAVDRFTEALATSRDAGEEHTAAVALVRLGMARLEMGELAEAKENLNRALEACRALELVHTEATALNTLGAVHLRLGDFDRSFECHDLALCRYRRLGSRHDQAEVLQNLAALHRDAHRLTDAVHYGEQALELARETRNLRFEADTLNTLATVRWGLRHLDAALAGHGEALCLARRVGYRQGEIASLIGLANTRATLGQAKSAVSAAREAVELARTSGFRLREAQALTVLAAGELELGLPGPARGHAEEALAMHLAAGNPLGQERSRQLIELSQTAAAGAS